MANVNGFPIMSSSGFGQSASTSKSTPEFPVVDESWELIDPNPDIYALFVAFNRDFFYTTLGGAEVKWSKRMTSCAGTCSFSPRGRSCVITLSEPLLKLRPRKDLVETLLHEMIHAYLFLYDGRQDREAHGPLFLEHMNRINSLTGAHISVYHSFHDEVRLYQTHWWRCEGPCKDRKPYFGYVKRSMNRAPGPNESWWKQHQSTCGGVFIKIREPAPKPAEPKKRGRPGVLSSSNSSRTELEGWAKLFGFRKTGAKTKDKDPPIPTPVASLSSCPSTSTSINTSSTSSGYFASAGVGFVLGHGNHQTKETSNPVKVVKTQDDSEWEDYRQFEEYANLSKSNNENHDSAMLVDDDDDVQFLGYS